MLTAGLDLLERDGPHREAAELWLAGHVCSACGRPTPPDELTAHWEERYCQRCNK